MTLVTQETKHLPGIMVEKTPYVGERSDNMIFPLSLFDGEHAKDFESFGLNAKDYQSLCDIASMSTGVLDSQSKEIKDSREVHRADAEVYLNQNRDIIAESYCVLRFSKTDQNIPNERIIASIKELLSDGIQAGIHFLSQIEGRDPNDILIFVSHGERNNIIEKMKKLPGISDLEIKEDGLHIYNFRRKVKRWTKEK